MARAFVFTVTVAAILVGVALLVAGCGFVVRRVLLRSAAPVPTLQPADLWIGLAAVVSYLEVWSLLTSITWRTWIAPLVTAVAGLAGAARRLRVSPRLTPAAVGLGVAVLWLANRALGRATDYDFGLYHAAEIEYASRFAALPGLGNLHDRLGASDANSLFVALLDRGPWQDAGLHLANGVLVTMLLGEIAFRLTRRTTPYATRLALLLLPATLFVVGIGTEYRLSSPNIDLVGFVLVAAGSLQLAECAERGFEPASGVAAAAAFALAGVTRPLFLIPTVIALAIVVGGGMRHGRRHSLLAAVLPTILVGGWATRQAVLSGYPFFPLTIGGLPVGWRMASSTIHQMNRVDEAWARQPLKDPNQVLASWSWLRWWLHKRSTDYDVLFPLLLFCSLPLALVARRVSRRGLRAERPLMLAVAIPAFATLDVWSLAPDPRFALAPLWLLPIALLAWVLPPLERSVFLPVRWIWVVYAAIVATLVTAVGLGATRWLVPAGLFAVLLPILLRWRSPVLSLDGFAYAAVAACMVGAVGVAAWRGAFDPFRADGSGPLGTDAVPTPAVEPFTTGSGLQLQHPTAGRDQCYRVLLCTPQLDPALRLRSHDLGSGFELPAAASTTRPSQAGTSTPRT